MWVQKALFKGTMIGFLLAGTFSGIIGAASYNRLNDVTVETEKIIIDPNPTIIYDKNGEKIAEFNKERKDKTTYDEIPVEIIDAITAIEDREFFDHIGINPKAIARAGVAYFANKGNITQGGSTITQQLVKTIYVGDEASFQRKIDEAILATTLEKNVSKEEIITAYLSHIDYGYQSFGIKNAVETYFGMTLEEFKQKDDVTKITMAAFLAGLPQAPYGYTPYDENGIKRTDVNRPLQRRNAVLHAMLVENKITKSEYDQAITNKDLLVLNKVKREHDDEVIKYPEFVHYVLQEVADQLNLSSVEEARYSGMKIYTSFDPEVYSVLRKEFNNDENFPEDAKDGTRVQGASVIVNPQNGEIYALTGSREETTGFLTGINRAFQIKRQPGSTLKPVISYGPAIEYNVFKKDSLLVNQKGYNFGNYVVKNWDNGGYGSVSMTEALRQSWNIPAVYALQQTGVKRARTFAMNLGIGLTENDIYLPIALGGLELGVSPLEMADSYQGFANGGHRVEAHAVKRMVNSNGEVVYESPTVLNESNRVMKEGTSEDIQYMLRNAVKNGTGVKGNVDGHMIAGKTGTNEYAGSKNGNSDIWFVGFSKDYVTAVWMGFDNNTPDRYLKKADGAGWTASMFNKIMTPLLKIRPDKESDYNKEEVIEEKLPQVRSLKVTNEYDEYDNVVTLSWKVKDNVMYRVYRNGEEIGAIIDENGQFSDTDLEPGTEYEYQVLGFDIYSQFKSYESKTVKIMTSGTKIEEQVEDTNSEDGSNPEEENTDNQ